MQIPSSGKGNQRQLAGEELLQQVGHLRGVVGAVDAAGLDDYRRQVLGVDHLLDDLVGLELGLLVVGGEVGLGVLVGLVDDLLVRVAEDADGGDVDDPGHFGLQRDPHHPLGPGDVGLPHRRALLGRDPDLVHRRRVDRRVAAAHPLAKGVLVAEVATDQLAAEGGQLRGFLGAADQADDLVAAVAQLAHNLAADEAGSARDEDLHGKAAYRPGDGAYNPLEWRLRKTGAVAGRVSAPWRSASSTAAATGSRWRS
jgi:hypothetical protein